MTILNQHGESMEDFLHIFAVQDWYSNPKVRGVLDSRGRGLCLKVQGEAAELDPERTLREWLSDRIVRRAIAGHLAKTRGISRAEAMTELRGLLA